MIRLNNFEFYTNGLLLKSHILPNNKVIMKLSIFLLLIFLVNSQAYQFGNDMQNIYKKIMSLNLKDSYIPKIKGFGDIGVALPGITNPSSKQAGKNNCNWTTRHNIISSTYIMSHLERVLKNIEKNKYASFVNKANYLLFKRGSNTIVNSNEALLEFIAYINWTFGNIIMGPDSSPIDVNKCYRKYNHGNDYEKDEELYNILETKHKTAIDRAFNALKGNSITEIIYALLALNSFKVSVIWNCKNVLSGKQECYARKRPLN
jgi:hypothetical protein